MSELEEVKEVICLICSRFFEKPVQLPCGEVICERHLIFAKNNGFSIKTLCIFCGNFHKISEHGFSELKNIKKLALYSRTKAKFNKLYIGWKKSMNDTHRVTDMKFEFFNIFDRAETQLDQMEYVFQSLNLDLEKFKNRFEKRVKKSISNDDYYLKYLNLERDLFFEGEKHIDSNNYLDFIRKYFVCEDLHHGIERIVQYHFDMELKKTSFEMNRDETRQFKCVEKNLPIVDARLG